MNLIFDQKALMELIILPIWDHCALRTAWNVFV